MTKAMEGFAKRHPQARIQEVFDPKTKITSYIFNDDANGFFDKSSVTQSTIQINGKEKVDSAYVNMIERRFYR